MGIAVIATGSAWLSTLVGLSAKAGATTTGAAAAMASLKGSRQTLNRRNPHTGTLMQLVPLGARRSRRYAMDMPPGEVIVE